MKILFGGIAAMIVGVVGLILWWSEFVEILKGILPILLILGGALGIYLGIEDVKSTSAAGSDETRGDSAL